MLAKSQCMRPRYRPELIIVILKTRLIQQLLHLGRFQYDDVINGTLFTIAGAYQVVVTLHARAHHLVVGANVATPDSRIVAKGLIVTAYFVVRIARTIRSQICLWAIFSANEQTIS